jgi:tetratricopeptide (TPR) repeat protein
MRTLMSVLSGLVLTAAAHAGPAEDSAEICFKDSGKTAIEACTRAIQSGHFKGSTLATMFNNRAIEYRQSRDYDRAIADYSQAIRLDANFTGAYAGRGLAHEGKSQLERAKADYQKALAMPPKYDDGKWAHDIARERLAALGEKLKP